MLQYTQISILLAPILGTFFFCISNFLNKTNILQQEQIDDILLKITNLQKKISQQQTTIDNLEMLIKTLPDYI